MWGLIWVDGRNDRAAQSPASNMGHDIAWLDLEQDPELISIHYPWSMTSYISLGWMKNIIFFWLVPWFLNKIDLSLKLLYANVEYLSFDQTNENTGFFGTVRGFLLKKIIPAELSPKRPRPIPGRKCALGSQGSTTWFFFRWLSPGIPGHTSLSSLINSTTADRPP